MRFVSSLGGLEAYRTVCLARRGHDPTLRDQRRLSAVIQQFGQTILVGSRQFRIAVHEVFVPRGQVGDRQACLLELSEQTLAAEGRQNGRTGQMLDERHD